MSSVKRRKIEEDNPSGPAEIRKKHKGTFPAPTAMSASPEPAGQSKETASEQEPQNDAPVQKSFKDLVCSCIEADEL